MRPDYFEFKNNLNLNYDSSKFFVCTSQNQFSKPNYGIVENDYEINKFSIFFASKFVDVFRQPIFDLLGFESKPVYKSNGTDLSNKEAIK